MTAPILEDFVRVYETLHKDNLDQLKSLYRDDVSFIDAVHQVDGWPALEQYFHNLYANLHYCRFTIKETQGGDQQGFVCWQMHYAHPKVRSGQEVTVDGVSHLKFDQRIYYHRDYMDMGQMLYEHLPLLGGAVRLIKKRMAS